MNTKTPFIINTYKESEIPEKFESNQLYIIDNDDTNRTVVPSYDLLNDKISEVQISVDKDLYPLSVLSASENPIASKAVISGFVIAEKYIGAIQKSILGFDEKFTILNNQFKSLTDLEKELPAENQPVNDTVKVIDNEKVVYYTVTELSDGTKVWTETQRDQAAYIPTQNIDTFASASPILFKANSDEMKIDDLSSNERVPSSLRVKKMFDNLSSEYVSKDVVNSPTVDDKLVTSSDVDVKVASSIENLSSEIHNWLTNEDKGYVKTSLTGDNKIATIADVAGLSGAIHFKGIIDNSDPALDDRDLILEKFSDITRGDIVINIANSKEYLCISEESKKAKKDDIIELGDEGLYVTRNEFKLSVDSLVSSDESLAADIKKEADEISAEIKNREKNDNYLSNAINDSHIVRYDDDPDVAGRRHITLKNHDNILGYLSDAAAGTVNLAMVSKWNVADFGSSTIHMNLNSLSDNITINDDKHVATKEYVDELCSSLSTTVDVKINEEKDARTADDKYLSGQIDLKVTDTINVSGVGKSRIFNEKDGGGAKFEHEDGTESFVGVNDGGESGLVAQIYADKLIDNKWNGSKLDVTLDGMYYTVGDKSFTERAVPENELQTKKNLIELSNDINNIINDEITDRKNEDQILSIKIDSEISSRISADKALSNDLMSEIAKKVDKEVPTGKGIACIFNEKSGGGAKIEDTANNIWSFAGVNQPDEISGSYGSLYVADSLSGIGSRLKMFKDGFNYKKDSKNWNSFETSAEIAVRQDINDAADIAQRYIDDKIGKEKDARIADDKVLSNAINDSHIVRYDDDPDVAGRRHITLKNHDNILGHLSGENDGTVNLAMVSKWNVADFGSSTIHMNLNSLSGDVTINDDKHVATKEYVDELCSSISTTIDDAITKEENTRIANDKYLSGQIDLKVTDTINVSGVGKSRIFNEKDGGGAKFEGSNGITSFVGVHDYKTDVAVAGQMYVKSDDGTVKLNMYKDKFTYVTDDAKTGFEDDDREIAVKKDINDLSDSLSVTINKELAEIQSDISYVSCEVSSFSNNWKKSVDLSAADISAYAEKLNSDIIEEATDRKNADEALSNDLMTEIAKKTDKEVPTGKGIARIFNEVDGGGAKIEDNLNKVWSFAGVNQPSSDSGSYGSLYVVDKDSAVGARLKMFKDGFNYKKNSENWNSFEASVEIAVKQDIDDLSSDIQKYLTQSDRGYVQSDVTDTNKVATMKDVAGISAISFLGTFTYEGDVKDIDGERQILIDEYHIAPKGGVIISQKSTREYIRVNVSEIPVLDDWIVLGDEQTYATKAALSLSVKNLTSVDDELFANDKYLSGQIDLKVTDTINIPNVGKSRIFNEVDGGGAKFEGSNGITSFVGVHDYTTDVSVAGQMYVTNGSHTVKLNMYKDKFTYVTDDAKTGFEDDDREIAVKKDINDLSDTISSTYLSASLFETLSNNIGLSAANNSNPVATLKDIPNLSGQNFYLSSDIKSILGALITVLNGNFIIPPAQI